MANYVLIHGAGSDAWYWHLVAPILRDGGHNVIASDLPCTDDSAGLDEYADVVVRDVGHRRDMVVVAQSMGAFTAPLLCDRLAVRKMILVAAMVPASGESPGEWWVNTGHESARRELDVREGRDPDAGFDPFTTFLHDVPPDVAAASAAHVHPQSGTPFMKPWPLAAWPDVPTTVLLCRNDRFFPVAFMRRVVKERLGITPDDMGSGHLPALAHPRELAARLAAYADAPAAD